MGLVLGDLFEESLLQTLILFEGDLTQLSDRPIAIAFLVVALVALSWSVRGMIGHGRSLPATSGES
jgi:TctA family transporter